MATTRKNKFKKRVKNFLVFYTFIGILFVASYTFSRYVEVTQGTGGIDIAKFNVMVNGEDVTEDQPFILDYQKDNETSEKIVPNSTGYFEFEINPSGSEVSLEYTFQFDLKDLDKDFKLLYYTINDDNDTHYNITDENIVKNDLLLPTTEHGFSDSDKINIKVYWSWDAQDITNPNIAEIDNKDINIIAIIKQKLN